jgi:hypothetical protein
MKFQGYVSIAPTSSDRVVVTPVNTASPGASSDVENLLMNRAFPVEDLSREKLSSPPSADMLHTITLWTILSSIASLDLPRSARTIPNTPSAEKRRRFDVNTAVHRFEELIAGHSYLIEVAAVPNDRWRAYIVRVPGVPTALMPFYGATPHEAAAQLLSWLTGAHERAASGARRV